MCSEGLQLKVFFANLGVEMKVRFGNGSVPVRVRCPEVDGGPVGVLSCLTAVSGCGDLSLWSPIYKENPEHLPYRSLESARTAQAIIHGRVKHN